MMSIQEKERLRALLKYLGHQQLAEQYEEEALHIKKVLSPKQETRSSIDVSHRLRDTQGRFLPYDSTTMEESDWIYDKEELEPRKLKVEVIPNSYNSYIVKDKVGGFTWDDAYLIGIAGILLLFLII